MSEHSLTRRTVLQAAAPLALLGAVSTACATSKVAGTPKFGLSSVPTSPSPTPSPSPSSSPAPEQVSLAMWLIDNNTGHDVVQKALNAFGSDNSEITPTATWLDFGTIIPKLQTTAAAGQGPDVLQYWPDATLLQEGLYAPVDDLIASFRSDFLPATLQTVTFKDKVYGVPVIEDASFFCYRKSVLSKAHVSPPTTLDQLISAGKKLTTSGRRGIGLGISTAEVQIAGPILWSAGLDYLTDDHQPGFTAARAIQAIGKIQRILSDLSALPLSAPEDVAGFLNGQVAIQWARVSQLPQMSAKFGDDLGIMPFPRLDGGGKPSVAVSTTSLLLGARSRHQDQARDLIRWLALDQTSYLIDSNLDATTLSIPPRRSVAQSAGRLKKGVGAQALQLATQYGRADSRPDWTGSMYAAYTSALRNIFQGHAKVSTALSAAAATVRTELKQIYK